MGGEGERLLAVGDVAVDENPQLEYRQSERHFEVGNEQYEQPDERNRQDRRQRQLIASRSHDGKFQLRKHPVHCSWWDRRLGHADYLVHCGLDPHRHLSLGCLRRFRARGRRPLTGHNHAEVCGGSAGAHELGGGLPRCRQELRLCEQLHLRNQWTGRCSFCMDEWVSNGVERQRRFEHVEVDRRRYLGPDYRTRVNHRLHRSSFQPRNLHDLLRVLGIHFVCSGPLVIATMPSSTLGRFHSRWIENLFVWNCWPLLVNTLWALMTAIHLNNPQGVLGQGDLLGFFQGVEGTILLSLASVIFALLIATIPMTARRILMGEYSPIGAAIAR